MAEIKSRAQGQMSQWAVDFSDQGQQAGHQAARI